MKRYKLEVFECLVKRVITSIPTYSTSILFSNIGLVTLTSLSNVTYSVVAQPVPEPEEWAMFLAGLGVVASYIRRKKT